MTQKVLKVGSSAAVTIPKKSLKDLGLKIGDSVRVEINQKSRTVSITPAVREIVDEELVRWTKSFIKRYRPALEALAKK
ncbi:MAG: AbrB/MazE/SpoVT family DNA-binding domain-containing protein [Patescibacteria group bacterium]